VIAWDGRTLAADKLADRGVRGTVTKIRRIGGCLVGCAGNAARAEHLMAWFAAGGGAATFPNWQDDKEEFVDMVVITPEREVHHYQRSAYPIRYAERQFAEGSGRDFAIAAMHLGYDARRAVEVACELDPRCGQGIDTLTLEGTP
jgi:ATP-dependent protease HslVU (ClpYQ) peptidase subunit